MKMTHGHKGSPISGDTHSRIEAHMHRASGGKTESPEKGDDDAEKDLKDKPERYNNSKVEEEAEAKKAKRGGSMKAKKADMKACGGAAKKHSGRKPRASGGGCESNPFTTALRGSGGHKVDKETEGEDD